jgi:uncharacterized protein (DUF1330 family)
MTLIAIMTVRRDAIRKFRSFESKAAVVMARHGGAIERTVVVPLADRNDLFKEVHIVTFPSTDAFSAYRQDLALEEIAHLRKEAVVDTEVMIGEDGPNYRPR